MSDPLHDHDVLIQRYVEGLLTEPEAAVLHEEITRRPELGRLLLDHLEMDAMLGEIAQAETALQVPMAAVSASRRRFSMATLAGVAGLAACLTLAGHASPPLPTAWRPSSWASSPFSWPSCRSTI